MAKETDLPPPSYDEAISGNSPYDITSGSSNIYNNSLPTGNLRPPAQPPRPISPQPPSRPPINSTPQDLYTANHSLPFRYPKNHFCNKCKNTGFKINNGKYCSSCWYDYYLNNNAFNPNPNLPFRYPRRFYCEKCNNTGIKTKNGLSCKDCYERFAPRNNISSQSAPFMDFAHPFDLFGTTTTTTYFAPPPPPMNGYSGPGFYPQGPPGPPPLGPPGNYYGPQPPPPPPPPPQQNIPLRVMPGDPRLGGILCGRCRGSGIANSFFDDMCPVCGGVGRIIGPGR